jgi:phage terminase large subunit-like protein
MTTPTDQVAQDLDAFNRAIDDLGPYGSFPYHRQQQFALAAYTDNVMVLGGNQSGKTTVGLGIVSRLIRREGPIYRRLRSPDTRPLKIWISPNLHEKWESNWEDRLLHQAFAGIPHHYVQSPHPVVSWDDAYADGNTLWGKSQEQGFMAFESDEVDLVLFDEEPLDRRLYTSALQRLAATNGVIVFTFTPLNGITWSFGSLYSPTAQPEHEVAPRVWIRRPTMTVIEMGMADNPLSVAGGGVQRLVDDPTISESERQARLYGKYGFTEGLIFPQFADLLVSNAKSPYVIPALPDDRNYSWFLLCDPNKRHGAVLAAIDHLGNRIYCAEHYAENLPDRLHADAYRRHLVQWAKRISPELAKRDPKHIDARNVLPLVDVWADPGGAGAQAILNLADVGVYAKPVVKDAGSVKASIELIRRAAWIDPLHPHLYTGKPGAPHVYFLSSLESQWTWEGVQFHESRLMWELRQYRQKPEAPPDTPIKERDDCVDPIRYLELVRPFTPSPEDLTVKRAREQLDPLSRRAADEFDDLLQRTTKRKGPFEPL